MSLLNDLRANFCSSGLLALQASDGAHVRQVRRNRKMICMVPALSCSMECCRKQYSIDELQGSKIVRRRPGVTTKTCIKIASTAQAGGSGSVEAPEVKMTFSHVCTS